MQKLEYKVHNPKYFQYFLNEKNKLKDALKQYNLDIIHIGSTSVDKLGGKDIIDIMMVAQDKDLDFLKKVLVSLNYKYHPKLSFGGRSFFGKPKYKNSDPIRIHLHLTTKNSLAHQKALEFKAYLQKDKKLAKNYQNFKKEAIKKAQGSYKKYRQIKNEYIDKILKSL